jgi:hypothetical protein
MNKNEQHGPCKLTGTAVFGSNHFKDLTPQEFKSQYLTGYAGPKMDELNHDKRRKLRTTNQVAVPPGRVRKEKDTEILSSNGLHDPNVISNRISRHSSVQERYLKEVQETPKLSKTYYSKEEKSNEKACLCGSSSSSSSSSSYSSYSYYNRRQRQRKLTSFFQRDSPLFGKTYYNKSEKSKVCGSSYGKTYHSSNSKGLDCSKYKLEADIDYDQISGKRTSSNSCEWYDVSCWLQNVFTPLYASKESLYSNYNYPSCKFNKMCMLCSSVFSCWKS